MDSTKQYRQSFTPKWKLGKPFAITNEGIEYMNKLYPYSRLSTITVTNAPSGIMPNGIAQVTLDRSTVLQLLYPAEQHQLFLTAMRYANEKINALSTNVKKYKYILQAEDGSHIEVYEDYLVLYKDTANMMTRMMLAEQSMSLTRTIRFVELLNICFNRPAEYNNGSLSFLDQNCLNPAPENTIVISPANAALAEEIVQFIETYRQSGAAETTLPDLPHLEYHPVVGEVHTFSLVGQTINIPENFDIANTYRKNYHALARDCIERFKRQYQMLVNDYRSFIAEFPGIYSENMEPLVQYSMDVLVAEGLWTVTKESFSNMHQEKFNGGYDHYNKLYEAGEKTLVVQQKRAAAATDMPRISWAMGFESIQKASAYNKMADMLTNIAQKNAGLTSSQMWELFNRIDLEHLAQRVYCDYANMWLTLATILNQNGKKLTSILLQDNGNAKSIFQNLSNPQFPQDKVAPVFLEIFQMAPYTKAYHQFMTDRFGDTDEVRAIREYFGFIDLSDPWTL